VRFINALIASGYKKIFAFVKRDASNARKTTRPLTTSAGRNPRMSNAYYAKVHIQPITKVVYKDLQKSFFPTLQSKMVASESQPRNESASIQTRLFQLGRSYASITRTEGRQPITSQNNQKTQEKMTSPGPDQLVAAAAQVLQYMMKEYMEKMGAMLNSLATLVTKITQ
jgi:hypothetical protein